MKSSSQKPARKRRSVSLLGLVAVGAVVGLSLGYFIGQSLQLQGSFQEILIFFATVWIGLIIGAFAQIVLHEAGHLLFGLMTGYTFLSFRVGSFMWVKCEGKIRLRRFSLAGTGGQCLLGPPDVKNGQFPFVLYNLGGSIMNLAVAAIFAGLYTAFPDTQVVSPLCVSIAIIGIMFAAMNGIPLRFQMVNNDGYNAWTLGKNPEALHALWLQLKIHEELTKGIRPKDMRDEWFQMPSAEALKNSMSASIGAIICNRMLDSHDFEKADQAMQTMLETGTGIVGLHRSLLMLDRVYCALITGDHSELLRKMSDKPMQAFIKKMKRFPSVQRTQYAYALLADGDTAEAERIKQRFMKDAEKYPYPAEIESELELMAYAEKIIATS
jgi:hypothetical protein